METKKKWYQGNAAIIAFLILFFPVGLYLMWKHAKWNKSVKWIITGLFAFSLLVNAVSGNKTSSTTTTNSQTNTPAVSQDTAATSQPVSTNEPNQTSQPTKAPIKATPTPVPAQTKQPSPASNETVSQKKCCQKSHIISWLLRLFS